MENDKINATITPSQIHDLREDGYSDAEIISAFFQSWNVSNHLKTLVAGYIAGISLHDFVYHEIFQKTATKACSLHKDRFAHQTYIALLTSLNFYFGDDASEHASHMQQTVADFITAICSSEIRYAANK